MMAQPPPRRASEWRTVVVRVVTQARQPYGIRACLRPSLAGALVCMLQSIAVVIGPQGMQSVWFLYFVRITKGGVRVGVRKSVWEQHI